MNIRYTDKKTLRISALLTALPVLLGWGFEIIRFLTPLTDRSTFAIRSHLYTLESIVESALFPILCIVLLALLFRGSLSFFHTNLLFLGSHVLYAMGMSILSNLNPALDSPAFSINGWLWRVEGLGEKTFLIFFSGCLLWGILNHKWSLPPLNSAFLLFQSAVFPLIISLNQYGQNGTVANPELLTHLYNLIPTFAILLAALHIFLAYFLWRAE